MPRLALGMMHILFRDRREDADYLERYCIGAAQLRERVLTEYPPDKVSAITGIPVADIETLTEEFAGTMLERGGPSLIRLNYGMQRHGGGGMAVRTITCLPAVAGSWRYPGGGALLSTSQLAPFNSVALERPDLIPPGTRTINMVHLPEALNNELAPPPVRAMYVYNSNPAAINPDQSRVIQGLMREDLFTVVHEQFQTDTADFADILLPATTQLEHFDIHNAYGQLYIQTNEPAIAPRGESKSNNDVFRLLAKAMRFEPELFEIGDEELAKQSLVVNGSNRAYPPQTAFDGISLERLREEGPIRLNLPKDYAPFAEGKFGTTSGKCELYSAKMAVLGMDPLPTYIPPHEDPLTKPEMAAKYPLQMICPPESSFLNSTFVNVDSLRRSAGEPTVQLHPDDAMKRRIDPDQWVRVFNDRGSFRAKAIVGEMVKAGVVVSLGVWWNRYTTDGVNCNTTTSTALTDLGGGATFFDNLVEVEPLAG